MCQEVGLSLGSATVGGFFVGEHRSDVEVSGDSLDVFTQPFDVWDAYG